MQSRESFNGGERGVGEEEEGGTKREAKVWALMEVIFYNNNY